MTSNLLSRFLSTNPTKRSIYEELREHDEGSEPDIEEQAGLALDEENLRFRDEELEHEEVFNGEDSRITVGSGAPFLSHDGNRLLDGAVGGKRNRDEETSKCVPQSPRLLDDEDADADDDVPQSLLIEDHVIAGPSSPSQPRNRPQKQRKRQPAIPGPSSRENRAHWEAAQAQQQLHQDTRQDYQSRTRERPAAQMFTGSPKDKAMWRWNNVTNIDNFLHGVYHYYRGCGFWCIVMAMSLSILQQIFLAVFVTFLTFCIDYKLIPHSKKLSQVLIPKCTTEISGLANAIIWIFTLAVFIQIYGLVFRTIPYLFRMRDFFTHLLGVPESDMQTVTWQDVVARLMAMRDTNPNLIERLSSRNRNFIGRNSKERLDAHDIANRLMRRENYFIAMFNKDILDLTLPVPFLRGVPLLSKHLMESLDFTIMDFMFNPQGQISQLVLKDSKRQQLSGGLKNRFILMGLGYAICAPFSLVYHMIMFFLEYFNEYKKNPSAIGSRQYTPLAEWKFREFNELEHLFHERLNMSYPFATRYLEQFPKVKTNHLAGFVRFITGSIVAVLTLALFWDFELFFAFEIYSEMNVALCLTIAGGFWAVAHGATPEPNGVFDPEYALRQVVEYTHYKPPHWENRLQSDEVKREFAALYQPKIMQFFLEMISIIATPIILWYSLPKCSDQIVDFFREFTIHVDGVGYVCSFAVFDFKRGDGRAAKQGNGTDPREDYYSTKQGKMTASYYGFLDNYVLNPKTGIQGHIPPGTRQIFNLPPSFPGLMSPTLAADMQTSRTGRSERRPAKGPGGLAQAARTPRFAPAGAHGSPMTSILLDPHHQPSSSGFGARSGHRNSRSRYQPRDNITEELVEDEERSGRTLKKDSSSRNPYESVVGLGESRWELSPVRDVSNDDEDEAEKKSSEAEGVIGLLYKYHTAQNRRPGMNI
ncbi:autophagy-related protein 9 [Amylocarpus encephaloides]|uniref:Autophagy-related protein 9 n=1 Tax=Amylocarpus encephaloides TaxID=45428 RepID=A0A9P7YET7_9HELO|nr:autophagy-related protein 9 [Amylocarpus encephaloides]